MRFFYYSQLMMSSRCPKKELCGSCSWSSIPYEKQLAQKRSDINGSFRLKHLDLVCSEIVGSPITDHYRNRMDFVINFEGKVGLREKGTWWRVIDNHTCFLADEQIDALFTQVREWVQKSGLSCYDRKTHEGFLRYAVIRSTTTGQTMLTLVTSPPKTSDDLTQLQTMTMLPTTFIHSINDTDSDVSFGEELHLLNGPGYIEELIDEKTYRISPNAFFQTNSFTAPLLLSTVKKFCGDLSNKTLLDLYCGTGLFSIALASHAKQTIGIELNADAISDAKTNAQINNVEVHYIAAPTESYDWSVHQADIVILDPPRSGMHDRALADVLRIQPTEIVYVSCNPKNFAREMLKLQTRYFVTQMKAIDMFPHTPHVELVSRLVKK